MAGTAYLVLATMLDIYSAIEVNGMLTGRVYDVGNSRLVHQLTVMITNVGGQEHRFAFGIVSGDVTDDAGEALNGVRSLNVSLSWIVHVFGRHDVLLVN